MAPRTESTRRFGVPFLTQFHQKKAHSTFDPQQGYQALVTFIRENTLLSPDAQRYILQGVAAAYSSYYQAEDTLRSLSGGEKDLCSPDLDAILRLRHESYGVMAAALTSILNGPHCLEDEAKEWEKQMVMFEMGAGMVDSELDREEDQGKILTPVLACDDWDERLGQKKGEMAVFVHNRFLEAMTPREVSAFIKQTASVYPLLEPWAARATRILRRRKGILLRADLGRDEDLTAALR